MEVSFSKNPNDAPQEQPWIKPADSPAPSVTQTVAVVNHAPKAIAASEPFVLGDYLPGFKDIILPRINLVSNMGELKDTFTPGEIVYGQASVLFSPPRINAKTGNEEMPGTKPVSITFLGRVSERYSEKVVGGGRGIIVPTEEAVREAGGTLDFEEHKLKAASGMKLFQPLVDMLVAIEKPEHLKDDGTVFVFEADGKRYNFAFWSFKSTAYTEALKRVVFKDKSIGCLRGNFPEGGFPAYSYAISTREKTYPTGNKAHIPILIPNAKNTPEFKDLISGFIARAR